MEKRKKRKKRLTPKTISSATPEDKRFEIYDTVKKGLILRVTPTGNKSFAYRYWYDGKSKQRTIGSVENYTIAEAREKVEDWRKMLDDGIDPINEKQENKDAITLAEYIDRFKKEYLPRKLKPSTQRTYKSRLNIIQRHKKLSAKKLKDITRSDVREFLKNDAKDNPVNANRFHSILSKLFNEAVEDEILVKNPIKKMKKLTEEQPRDVRYTDDDIKAIWSAINQEWEPMQSLLKMLMITGQRLGETSKMKWSDIHNRTWIIPQADTKNKSSHEVPLPNTALNILKKMKSINDTTEYVFASQRDKTGHLTYFKGAIDRIRKATMLNDFRLHDLRHIVATEMIGLGVEFIIVGKVLNHKGLSANNAITSRYINDDMIEQKTKALNIWAGHLTELTSPLSIQKHG
jgi:integrase